MTENQKNCWEVSYRQGDNFVFYPHEEVIRFVSKYIRKRTGFDSFLDVSTLAPPPSTSLKVLDLGCGIGRHVKYCFEIGLEAYGVDLSETAIMAAKDWLSSCGMSDADGRIVQGDVRQLPWDNGFFAFAVSHGVLDSMPWEIARAACLELTRVMTPGGLFYCDLISGDDSSHAREYSGAEVVRTKHEENTIQLYFNMQLIRDLIRDCFSIKECKLIRSEDVLSGGYHSRYHLVLSRI
jgi:ubiquinone/menaquinone biosynthesis C-methylase UbiE